MQEDQSHGPGDRQINLDDLANELSIDNQVQKDDSDGEVDIQNSQVNKGLLNLVMTVMKVEKTTGRAITAADVTNIEDYIDD